MRCFLDHADSELASESGEAGARARGIYLDALQLLDADGMRLLMDGAYHDPAEAAGFAPNPEAVALRMHAETNRRKLQLSKTISLAELAPFELQQFRQTDVLVFATLVIARLDEASTSFTTNVITHRGEFFADVPPGGKPMQFMGLGIDRVVVGKVVQHWALPDWMGILRQFDVSMQGIRRYPCRTQQGRHRSPGVRVAHVASDRGRLAGHRSMVLESKPHGRRGPA